MLVDQDIYHGFLDSLVRGNRRDCHQRVTRLLESDIALNDLYFHLYQPAMYDISKLWEQNRISVATEHVATAITDGLLNLS